MNAVSKQEVQTWDERPAPVASETSAYISLIERAVMDPTFDLNRLERLIQMKDRALAEAAKQAFGRAMVECQKELPQVVRDAENTQTRSRYATIEAIGAAIDPIIHKHGFWQSFSSGDTPLPGCYRVICTTGHDAGHERVDHLDVPIDNAGAKGTVNKTVPHALASTITYGRRIITMLVFNIKSTKVLADDDGNAAGRGELIESEQFARLKQLMAEVAADEAKFLRYFRIEELTDLPASQFERAVAALEAKRAK